MTKVICIGEILFDCLADQITTDLDKVTTWSLYAGGAPANSACALIKLGIPSAFIGTVGNDVLGKSLSNLLQELGVNITGLQTHVSAPTRQVYVLRSDSGDRSFAGFSHSDPAVFADAFLQSEQMPVDLISHADFLVLGSLCLAYPHSREAIFKAVEIANEHHVKIILDVNRRDVFWPNPSDSLDLIHDLITHVDFLKVSEDEAQWLFDTVHPGAIAYKLDHLEGILVTAGEKGTAYYLSENQGFVSGFNVNTIDTTGAGDAFLAGFIHQLYHHGLSALSDPELAMSMVTYACAVGALTTTKNGAIAASPTLAEVEKFLQQLL